MKKLICSFAILFLCFTSYAQQDTGGCKDPALFTRLPNFYISECSENYNELALRISTEKTETKEGNFLSVTYYYNFDTGGKAKSPFQIMKNYENAVVKNGENWFIKIRTP